MNIPNSVFNTMLITMYRNIFISKIVTNFVTIMNLNLSIIPTIWPVIFMTTPGGGGLVALQMGRGVPPACSEPDPVPTRLAAKKTLCPIWKLTPIGLWCNYYQ